MLVERKPMAQRRSYCRGSGHLVSVQQLMSSALLRTVARKPAILGRNAADGAGLCVGMLQSGCEKLPLAAYRL